MKNIGFQGYALLLVVFFMSFFGCKNAKNDHKMRLLSFDTLYTYNNIDVYTHPDAPQMKVTVEYIFPNNDEEILNTFNEKMFGAKGVVGNAGKALNNYVAFLESYYRNNADSTEAVHLPEELLAKTFHLCNEIAYQDTMFVSGRIDKILYEGGIHPSNEITLFTIDRHTGKTLNERDLFVNGYQESLSKLLVTALQEKYRKENPEDLEPEGFFNTEEISSNGNFMLDDKGILYCFNEYEIATYALGAIFIRIDYATLSPILSPDSPAHFYFR